MAGDRRQTSGNTCKWCGQPVDATHGAGVCLKAVDRKLEVSVKASERRVSTIKAHIDALDEYMTSREFAVSRAKR